MSSQPIPSATRPLSALSTNLRNKTHDEIIEMCLTAGFAGIEAHCFLVIDQSDAELQKLGEKYRASGLKIDSFHLPYLDLASLDEPTRLHALEEFKTCVRQAAALGVRVGITHPTTKGHVITDGLEPLVAALERSLAELLPLAESLDVILALENLNPGDVERLGSAPEHFEIFRKRFAHPSLGFCLDTGHALLSLHERAADLAETMKSHLQAFHLNDNAGDRDSHLAPGRGLVNWVYIAQLLREINFTHIACIETPPFAYGPNYTLEAWKELRTNTAQLLPLEPRGR